MAAQEGRRPGAHAVACKSFVQGLLSPTAPPAFIALCFSGTKAAEHSTPNKQCLSSSALPEMLRSHNSYTTLSARLTVVMTA